MTLREVSQSYLGCFPQGCSLHFAPNKTYLTTLTVCIFLTLTNGIEKQERNNI